MIKFYKIGILGLLILIFSSFKLHLKDNYSWRALDPWVLKDSSFLISIDPILSKLKNKPDSIEIVVKKSKKQNNRYLVYIANFGRLDTKLARIDAQVEILYGNICSRQMASFPGLRRPYLWKFLLDHEITFRRIYTN